MPRGNWNRLWNGVDWAAELATGDSCLTVARRIGCSDGLVRKRWAELGWTPGPSRRPPPPPDPLDAQLDAMLLARHGEEVRKWLSCCERKGR